MATIIDGNKIAEKVRKEAAAKVVRAAEEGIEVGLAVILIGDNPASATYVLMKERDCEKCGIKAFDVRLPEDATQSQVNALIDRYNSDPAVHGILVQMPVPPQLNPEAIIARISPEKDVDGFHPRSLGSLVRGTPGFESCTPSGIMRLLKEYGIPIAGKHAVVVGRSTIVGKPMALMLLQADATVTICHSKTANLAEICKQADILVAACGRAKMITADFVKPGAVIIDVGMDRDDDGKLVGDVDFESVEPIASAITPVPGGVGPMTRAILMANTAAAALRTTEETLV